MATCGRHEVGSGSENDGEADRHDPAVQAVMEERQRQRERAKAGPAAAAATAAAAAATTTSTATPAAAVVVVPAPLPTSTAEQRADAERMRAGAAARTRPSGWFHAQEQRRVVIAAAAASGDGASSDADGRRRRQHLWASQNAAATGAALPTNDEQHQHQEREPSGPSDGATSSAAAAASCPPAPPLPHCKKCKASPAVALLRQNEPLCGACASDGALGKARATLRGGRLRPGDRAAVALSGGYGSLGMLRALLQLRARGGAQAGRPERGRIAFDVECLHVRESALFWLPLDPAGGVAGVAVARAAPVGGEHREGGEPEEEEEHCGWEHDAAVAAARAAAERRAEALERALAAAARALGHEGGLTVLRLEDVFDGGDDVEEGEEKNASSSSRENSNDDNTKKNLRALWRLLSAVRDRTGREDLAETLRARLLRRAAAARRCDALAFGDTAGTVAVRVIAGAAKGRLFSVPADIAPVALLPAASVGNGGASRPSSSPSSSPSPSSSLVVLRPVRDVTAAELAVSYRHASGRARSPEEEEQEEEDGRGEAGAAAAAARLAWSSGGSRRAPASLNALTRGFVSAIEAHMPASIYAVLRSAGALQAFPSNEDAALSAARRWAHRERPGVVAKAAEEGLGGEPQPPTAPGKAEEDAASHAPAGLATPAATWEAASSSSRCRICGCPLLPAEHREEEEDGAAGAGGAARGGGGGAWPRGSLGALDGGGAQGVCYSCERQVLDLMLTDEEEGEEKEEEKEAESREEEEDEDKAEAERRSRRARRRRRLARLRAMLPPS